MEILVVNKKCTQQIESTRRKFVSLFNGLFNFIEIIYLRDGDKSLLFCDLIS